jgi:hypothetical protein
MSGDPELQETLRLKTARKELEKHKQGSLTPQEHHSKIRKLFNEISAAGGSDLECCEKAQVHEFINKLHPKAFAEARLLWINAVTHNRIKSLFQNVNLLEAETWVSTLAITVNINGSDRTTTCLEYHEHLKTNKKPSKQEPASVNVASTQDTTNSSETKSSRKGKNKKGKNSNSKPASESQQAPQNSQQKSAKSSSAHQRGESKPDPQPPTPCAIKKPNGKPCGGAHWHNQCRYNPKSPSYQGDSRGSTQVEQRHALVSQNQKYETTEDQGYNSDNSFDALGYDSALQYALLTNAQLHDQDPSTQLKNALGVTTSPSNDAKLAGVEHLALNIPTEALALATPETIGTEPSAETQHKRRQNADARAIQEAEDWMQRKPVRKIGGNWSSPSSSTQSSPRDQSSPREEDEVVETPEPSEHPSVNVVTHSVAIYPAQELSLGSDIVASIVDPDAPNALDDLLTHKKKMAASRSYIIISLSHSKTGRFDFVRYKSLHKNDFWWRDYRRILAANAIIKVLKIRHELFNDLPPLLDCDLEDDCNNKNRYQRVLATPVLVTSIPSDVPAGPTKCCTNPRCECETTCNSTSLPVQQRGMTAFFKQHLKFISLREIDNLIQDQSISQDYGEKLKSLKHLQFQLYGQEKELAKRPVVAQCPALSTSGKPSLSQDIIFDSAASISICKDQTMFDGPIIRASTPMEIIGIHGHKMSATHYGFLPGFGNLRFWHLPGADYNLVSSSRAHDHGYPHTRDNESDAYIIHMPEQDIHFKRTKGGLYMVDLEDLVTQRANAGAARPTQQEIEERLEMQKDRLPFRCPICGGRSATKQAYNQHKCTGTPLKEHVAAAPPSSLTPNSTSPTEPVYTDALVKKLANVADRKKEFSAAEVKEAERVISTSQSLGHSSLTALLRLVNTQSFGNLGITAQGVRRAAYIFGENPHYLQGNITASPPSRDKRTFQPRDAIPPEQQKQHCQFDLFFIEGTKYMLMFLEPLGYIITQSLDRKTQDEIGRYIFQHLAYIKKQGFEVTNIKTDGEPALRALAPIFVRLHDLEVDRLGTGDHAPRAERAIRKVKEVVRSTLHSLPYRLPVSLLPHLVSHATRIINFIPSKDSKVSPYTRFTGHIPNFKTQMRHKFGEYAMLHPSHTSNTMHSRATHGILLESSGSSNGSVFCYNLETHHITLRQNWRILPITAGVIQHMNDIASGKPPTPLVSNASLKLSKDKKRVELPPEEEDDDSPPHLLDDEDPSPITLEAIRGPNAIRPNSPTPLPVTSGLPTSDVQNFSSLPLQATSTRRGAPAIAGGGGGDTSPARAHRGASTAGGGGGTFITSTPATAGGSDSHYPPASSIAGGGPATPRPRGRPRKVPTVDSDHTQGAVFASIVNAKKASQMTLKQALRVHPTQTQVAATAEIKQLLDKQVFHPVLRRNLTTNQNKSIIPSSCFIKHKYRPDGSYEKCKARLVAGGHRQDRTLYEDVSSPTVKSQSVLMVAALAASEHRSVATIDVSGAYLHAPITSVRVFVRLEPTIAQIITKIDSTYKYYLTEKGELIVELDRALYGCVESARAWYNLLTSFLIDYGFIPNPFDKCVFNRASKSGAQLTVCVHVDDLFITCKDSAELHMFIEALNKRFSGCNVHTQGPYNYIGMTFEFLKPNHGERKSSSVKVSQVKLIDEILNDAGNVASRATPASESLFTIVDGAMKLATKEREIFHSRVAKLLYIAKHSRPDILLAVSFLTTRVKQPDEADADKLARLIGYISATRDKCLILNGVERKVVAHVDASFAVHPEMQSHTGIVISIGSGAVFAKSSKQRLVTKSSTEAELVGLSDALGYIIWTRNWMMAQGYRNEPATIYQDNQSTIVLAHKGHTSGERTRHINIRYFFIMDRINGGEVVVKYLHTSQMTADGGSKPLQGRNFHNFVKAILNLK